MSRVFYRHYAFKTHGGNWLAHEPGDLSKTYWSDDFDIHRCLFYDKSYIKARTMILAGSIYDYYFYDKQVEKKVDIPTLL